MIVTCQACSTRYLVDPRALGSAGRTVRCAKCAHTWHQVPPTDSPRSIDLVLDDEGDPPRIIGSRSQLPIAAPRRKRFGGFARLLLVLILVLGALVGAVAARDQVVAFWPAAAALYAEIGLRTTPPASNFEIRKMALSLDKENGAQVVIVEGEIANVSNAARDVPKLRLILKDKEGKEVDQSTIAVPGPRLLPGASVPFRTSIPQPSTAATSVVVMVADDG
jgi:predicted Zn finger-like uncharacterized protein